MITNRLASITVAISAVPALPTAALAQACGVDNIFPTSATFPLAEEPRSIALADVDNDGDADAIAAVRSTRSVSLFFNDGTGAFGAEQTIAVGEEPFDAKLADLNGDGFADIVTALLFRGTAGVQLNNGDGTFGALRQFGAGAGPIAIALDDLDGDGDTDIVVANQGTGSPSTISILLNNGDATFAPDQEYGVGVSPEAVSLGDLDGDGDLDVAVANDADNIVSVLLNNGDGTLAPQQTYAVDERARDVAIADLDGDGDEDIAVAGASTLSILLNNGDGTFAPRRSLDAPGLDIALADVDGDNDPDIITGRSGYTVLRNNGDATFAPADTYGSGSAEDLQLADLDGNGLPDIAGVSGSNLQVRLNCGPFGATVAAQPAAVVLLPAGGGVAELTVRPGGTAPYSYQWRREGVPLVDGGGISGATSPTLVVDASAEDTGAYDVVVTNVAGSDTSDVGVIAVRLPCQADFDGDGVLNIFDFLAFSNAFDVGCP